MEIYKAYNIEDALKHLSAGCRPLAGATNIFVDRKVKGEPGCGFVDIISLKELTGINETDTGISIGALTTFAEIEEYFKDRKNHTALYDMAYMMGGPQIRNMATVAGNICDASPACDAGPVLLALNAEITALSESGTRTILMKDFFEGKRKTNLRPGEMVTEIRIPKTEGVSFFKKAGQRNALTVSLVSIAGKQYPDGSIWLAAGSAAPMPVRLYNCEKYLGNGKEYSPAELETNLKEDICPIEDRGYSAEYRYKTALRMIEGALEREFGYEQV